MNTSHLCNHYIFMSLFHLTIFYYYYYYYYYYYHTQFFS